MKLRRLHCFKVGILVAFVTAILSGCEYDMPITQKPTQKIDARLLGDWSGMDGTEKVEMKVRKLDDSVYTLTYNGELVRAFHTNVASTAFISAQDLSDDTRKYAYLNWELSRDGKTLRLRAVNSDVIPSTIKTSTEMSRLIEKNLTNPKLYEDELVMTKK